MILIILLFVLYIKIPQKILCDLRIPIFKFDYLEKIILWVFFYLQSWITLNHWPKKRSSNYLSGEDNGTPLQYSCLENPMDRRNLVGYRGSGGVGHDWATSLSLFTFMHWKREWQPTPVFLPGESQGPRSLVGCRLWGRTESDTTEATQQQQLF